MEVEEERMRNEEIEGVAIDLAIVQRPSTYIHGISPIHLPAVRMTDHVLAETLTI